MTVDQEWIALAHETRKRSTCRRGKVGVVIVHRPGPWSGHISAYNGAPNGHPCCDDLGCSIEQNIHMAGCRRTVHAELNCLLECAKQGFPCRGASMYSTHAPCYSCAKAIVVAGIARFVYTSPYRMMDGMDVLHEHSIAIQQIGRIP